MDSTQYEHYMYTVETTQTLWAIKTSPHTTRQDTAITAIQEQVDTDNTIGYLSH